ncbi:hypothetical protein MMC07_005294 [Pseudocyphellaria aurata]|nr:hypothetical protein [Pseudocyphellaria aurata]
MPPKRRTKSTLSTQQTLAFGPRNKVTKPTAPPPASKKKLKPSPLSQESDSQTLSTTSAAVTLEEDETDDADALRRKRSNDEEVQKKPSMLPKSPGGRLSIREVKSAAAPARSEVEERAARLSDAELKRYWRAQEEERTAKRVHQEGLSMNEKILRHFDLSSQYGPCIGIARMKRWKRAHGLDLNPPIQVLAVLLREQQQQASGPHNSSSGKDVDRAYLDDLLSARVGVD